MAIATHQNRGRAHAGKDDARRFPRQAVSWLVTVSSGSRQLQGRTKDTSVAGAKILVDERLPLGSQVLLQFRPAGRSPVETQALVWRLDADGFACVFVGSQGPKFMDLAALGACGYTVLDAGPQPLLALRFAQEHAAPIDLFDVELQLMNGMPLVQRLMPERPAAKVLLVATGSGQRPTVPEASWLSTPCTREELAACVQRLLEVETK